MIVEIATHPVTELLAILTFTLYVILAARASVWCWAAGFLTSFLYTVIFLGMHVPSQLFLNILYMVMSVWGWSEWSTKVRSPEQSSLFGYTPVKRQLSVLPLLAMAVALFMIFLPSVFLNVNPLADASITVMSIYATILTVYRRIESWLYWIVLNSSNAWLFWQEDFRQTAFLHLMMALVALYGFINWRKIRRWEMRNGEYA